MKSNPYLALGVRPFINCCSVRTMHGGSLMLPQVREAIDAASTAARTSGSIRLPPCIVRTLQQLMNGLTPSAR